MQVEDEKQDSRNTDKRQYNYGLSMFLEEAEYGTGILDTDYSEKTGLERYLAEVEAGPDPGFSKLVDDDNQQPEAAEDNEPPPSQLAAFL